MNRNKRNITIDLWRIIFSFILVMFHGKVFYGKDGIWFGRGGNLCTEFFFIVSGYLLNKSVLNEQLRIGKSEDLGRDTISFIKRKMSPVYPYFLLSFLAMFISNEILGQKTVSAMIVDIFAAIPELLLVRMAGWRPKYNGYNGPGWYLSAMFLVFLILYPIIRNHRSLFSKVIAPLTSIILLGYLIQVEGTITNITNYYTFFMASGVKRALAEICCGCFVFECCELIRKKKFTRLGKILISLIEIAAYGTVIMFNYKGLRGNLSAIVVIIYAIAIGFTFSEQSYQSQLINRQFAFLGKIPLQEYSLSIFLNHFFVRSVLYNFIRITDLLSPRKVIAVYLASSAVYAVICMIIVRIVKALWKKCSEMHIFAAEKNGM